MEKITKTQLKALLDDKAAKYFGIKIEDATDNKPCSQRHIDQEQSRIQGEEKGRQGKAGILYVDGIFARQIASQSSFQSRHNGQRRRDSKVS